MILAEAIKVNASEFKGVRENDGQSDTAAAKATVEAALEAMATAAVAATLAKTIRPGKGDNLTLVGEWH